MAIITATPSNTPSNTPTISASGTACPTPTPTNTPTNTSTPTNTPTPSVTPVYACNCITFTNTGATQGSGFYTSCNGFQNSRINVPAGEVREVCGSAPEATGQIIYQEGFPCISGSCPEYNSIYELYSGITSCDGCVQTSGIVTAYSVSENPPASGDTLYLNTLLTIPAPNGFYTNGTGAWFQVTGGAGLITAEDPTGCVDDLCPSPTPTIGLSPTPTPTNTQTNTPTNTSTPTQTPTNTQTNTPTNTGTPTPTPTNVGCLCYTLTNDPPAPPEPALGATTFQYRQCDGGSIQFITVFDGSPVNVCARVGTVVRNSGDPGSISESEFDCCVEPPVVPCEQLQICAPTVSGERVVVNYIDCSNNFYQAEIYWGGGCSLYCVTSYEVIEEGIGSSVTITGLCA
jgi:hypothetical protein